MYAISSYSLQVRKFGTKTWTEFTTTRGKNHRLTSLDPDTVYFVRLKSENKYGKGKPSEDAELRTEKGMFQTQLVPVHFDLPLFWKPYCATWVPASVILYHVTGLCKGPVEPTSFPGSLILPPPEASGKMRDPGNEVAVEQKSAYANNGFSSKME